jgi:hypothetical protein
MKIPSIANSTLPLTAILLGASLSVGAQAGYPAPPTGAPAALCAFDTAPADTPIRILTGDGPIPYAFACGYKNSPACIGGTLKPGLVVSLGAERNGWSCVTDGDASGWIPSSRLAYVPDTPHIPESSWIGWWQEGKPAPGIKNDRLLITRGSSPGTLHISGRAYWYGMNDNVHIGELPPIDAKPIGPYLHIVSGNNLSDCVVDLKYDPATRTLHALDNGQCGGMNVRFGGTWTKFTPSTGETKH